MQTGTARKPLGQINSTTHGVLQLLNDLGGYATAGTITEFHPFAFRRDTFKPLINHGWVNQPKGKRTPYCITPEGLEELKRRGQYEEWCYDRHNLLSGHWHKVWGVRTLPWTVLTDFDPIETNLRTNPRPDYTRPNCPLHLNCTIV